MPKKLSIDPVTRIEGHLAIETSIGDGVVTGARVAGRMYRGFEQLLIGRHPIDAARITQRICGICHEVHGIAASIALEDLYNITPTANGLVLRDLILGLHLVTDHIFHFYQLTLPDYVDFSLLQKYEGKDRRVASLKQMFGNSDAFAGQKLNDAIVEPELVANMALGYSESINIRKDAGSGLASLGGKVPFCHAVLPGGMTTAITTDRLMNYAKALKDTIDFVERYYLPQAVQLAEQFPDYFGIGVSHGNFYGNEGFSRLGEPLYRDGILLKDSGRKALEFSRIGEVLDASFIDRDGKPRANKKDAYSWVKAIAYDGMPMEVGPLARLAVNEDADFMALLKRCGRQAVTSSVMARILARAFEARKICSYLETLMSTYQLGESTINSPDMTANPSGSGTGMSLAARGALNHQVTARDGKVSGYKLQMPSAWNFGPAVNGRRGTVEEALVGTRLSEKSSNGSGKDAIEIGRIVRSFDPCLACAIH